MLEEGKGYKSRVKRRMSKKSKKKKNKGFQPFQYFKSKGGH